MGSMPRARKFCCGGRFPKAVMAPRGGFLLIIQPATVGVLRQLAPELALVHAQSETMVAFDQAQQRLLLDRYGVISSDAVAAAFAEWGRLWTEIDELQGAEQDRLRRVDLWSFQAREIEAAELTDMRKIRGWIRRSGCWRTRSDCLPELRRRRNCCMRRRFRRRRCWGRR